MPFLFDFEKSLSEIKEVKIYPKGWQPNIIIEYCFAQAHNYDTMISMCWRVKGTSHTFTIYDNKLKDICNNDYEKHFAEVLEKFREDYLSWFREEEYSECDWKWEYKRQFDRFIIEEL